jgi:hypothetical protein
MEAGQVKTDRKDEAGGSVKAGRGRGGGEGRKGDGWRMKE